MKQKQKRQVNNKKKMSLMYALKAYIPGLALTSSALPL